MNVRYIDIDVVEEVRVELDGVAGGHEDHDLLVLVLAEEREQQLEFLLRLDNYVALLQVLHGGGLGLAAGFDEHWVLKTHSAEVFYFFCLGRGKEEGYALFGQEGEDLVHFFFETVFQDGVSLVDNEHHEVMKDEAFCVLKMVEEATWSCDKQVYAFFKQVCFGRSFCSTYNNTMSFSMSL